MGGDSFRQQTPLFEEAKLSGDEIDIFERVFFMFDTHPLHACVSLGLMILSLLLYVFLQLDHSHIKNNPEIQFHKRQVKKDEEEFRAQMKVRYRYLQDKERYKLREFNEKEKE
jgi:hypothetical protein